MPKKAGTPPVRTRNGRVRLDEAIALLIANEAEFLRRMAEMDARFARMDERFARNDERFARMDQRLEERFAKIEGELEAIKRILLHHEEILQNLPKTIKREMGFKPR